MSGDFFLNKWIFFESYIKVVVTDRVLVYNTLNGDFFESDDLDIVNFVNEVTCSATNPIFSIGLKTLKKLPTLQLFLEALFSRYMIEVVPMQSSGEKPFVFMPQVKINKDFLNGRGEPYTGESCYEYLNQLIINLSRNIPIRENYQHLAKRQHFFFDSFGEPLAIINPAALDRFCTELKNTPLREITVVINPIAGHPALGKIMKILQKSVATQHFVLDYKDAVANGKMLGHLTRGMNCRYTAVIPFQQDEEDMAEKLHEARRQIGSGLETLFLIGDEKDLEKIEALKDHLQDLKVNCLPIFNGENMEFFEEFVFLRKENIFAKKHSYNDIFCNETLNRTSFGRLYVDAAGECCGDLGEGSLGNIAVCSLGQVIYKELQEGEAWKRIRMKADTCSDCIYNRFCPPISNYELVMKRNNLCHLQS